MPTLKVPAALDSIVIGDTVYKRDKEGQIEVSDDHVDSARLIGCRAPDELFPGEQVKAEIPDELLEGMADPETVRALIAENEALKAENELLNRRISIFETQLADAETRLAATEDATEAAPAVEGGSGATTAADAPPAATKTDIDAMSYDEVKHFLLDRGVAISGNIKKDDAVKLAKKQLTAKSDA